MRTSLTALALCALAFASCDSPSGPEGPGIPARLEVVSGDDQQGTVGAELPQPLVVRVVDDQGDPVAGQIVNFRVVSGGGSVFAGATLTDAQGQARERWTLGTSTADSQRVEARAVDTATGQALVFGTFRATAAAGAPAAIVSVGPAARSGTAGAPLADSLAAQVRDQYGNPMPQASVVWTVRSGGGTMSPATSVTNAQGVARSLWTLGTRVDSAQAAEAAAGVTVRTEFTATAGTPLGAALVVRSGGGQAATAGSALAQPVRVALLLPTGVPVVGATVTWTPSAGSASPQSSLTDGNGEASTTWTLGTAAGVQGLTASSPGAAPVTVIATAHPGPAAQVVKVAGDGQSAPAGSALAQPLVVKVADAHGNGIAGAPVAWAVTSGGGAVSPVTGTTDAAGRFATAWTLGGAAGTQTARATSGTLPPAEFTAHTTAAARLVPLVDTLRLGGSVGGPARDSLAVRVLDSAGNPLPGMQVTWEATEGGGSVSPAASTSDASGVARAQWTLGPRTDVVQGAVASAPGAHRVSFYGRAASSITAIRGNGITASAGTPVDVAVTLDGGSAGPVPGVRVQWTVLSGGGSVSPATSITGQAGSTGVASATWTLGPSAGTQTLRATAGTLQTTFTVTATALGTRTLVAQVPGQALDATADRVLWLDTSGGTRRIRIRTLSTGTDVTVKADTPSASATYTVYGHLFDGGALVWSNENRAFEHRGGTLAYLGGITPSVEEGWAAWDDGTSVVRRELDTGAHQVVGPGGAVSVDVGADGDVVFLHGGGAWRYAGGALAPVSTEGSPSSISTDGVNVVYAVVSAAFSSATLWLDRGADDVALAGHSSKSGGLIYFRLNGGWIAYATPLSPVFRRSPAGATEQITTETTGTRVEALAPDGTLVYHHPTSSGHYYLVAPDGARGDVGPSAAGDRVAWRDGRLLLFSGGSVYRLAL